MPTRPQLTVPRPTLGPILSVFAEVVRRPLARLPVVFGPLVSRADSNVPARKRQLIDDIRSLNGTATFKFLVRFDERALRHYLEHLTAARAKRVRPLATSRRPAARASA